MKPVKRSKANMADIYFIENNPKGLTEEQLSEELGLKVAVVREIRKVPDKVASPISTVKTTISDGFVRRREATLMTQQASEKSDELRKNSKPKFRDDIIAKIKN